MRFTGIFLATVTAVILLGASPTLAQTLILNTANDPPNVTDEHTGSCDRILTEACKRLGITLQIVNLPSERALINANEGIDDGNFARVEGMEKLYPNLIRVNEAITNFEFVAFSRDAALKINGWESLAPYHVGIVTGWKILETNIVKFQSLTKVRDEKLLFDLLRDGKVDVVVYDRRQGEVVLKQIVAPGIKVLQPPLAVKEMYPYLHKRHAALVPQLAATLRGMKEDGTMKKIQEATLRAFVLEKQGMMHSQKALALITT